MLKVRKLIGCSGRCLVGVERHLLIHTGDNLNTRNLDSLLLPGRMCPGSPCSALGCVRQNFISWDYWKRSNLFQTNIFITMIIIYLSGSNSIHRASHSSPTLQLCYARDNAFSWKEEVNLTLGFHLQRVGLGSVGFNDFVCLMVRLKRFPKFQQIIFL